MTDDWGIDDCYEDAAGDEQRIAPATIEQLRHIIGRPPGGDPPVLVVRRGGRLPGGPSVVVLEDGREVRVDGSVPNDLALGYHTLVPLDDSPSRRLIVSPGRCYLPARRAWGWVAQLYATRSNQSWGMGDLGDLARLTRWSAGELGAGFILVNPLHATAPTIPQQPSPYFPSTRRFRNPIYLRIEDVPGAADAGADLGRLAAAGRALNQRREINRDEVWRLKLAALEAIWALRRHDTDFETWYRQATTDLRQFATWAALTERFGPNWREWSSDYQHPDCPAVAQFTAEHYDRVRFHAWLQWLTNRQLDAAATDLTVMQDLPIGVDPAGADAWAWQDLFATGVTVGAPPDELNRQGQDWGLPPFVPWRLAYAGYQPFIDTIRSTLALGGGLRIDHVMGLFRLWWVPAGSGPANGAYVRYPADDLLDIVALESHRAQAIVVGEDLGTIEKTAQKAMAKRNFLSYRLLWFEKDHPTTWPATAMAAITTHDLPTVAGLWDGSDLKTQHTLGLNPNEESTHEIRERLATAGGLADVPVTDAVLAAHRLLAQAPAFLLAATLDDAIGEPQRPNIPGADGKYPNWSLALPIPVEDLPSHTLTNQVATTLRDATTNRRRSRSRRGRR
ncbi:MAG: 4-alpha-glucanotransferase [Pseudonocardiaceae bacterium]